MEENVLIKSIPDKKTTKILKIIAIVSIALTLIVLISSLLSAEFNRQSYIKEEYSAELVEHYIITEKAFSRPPYRYDEKIPDYYETYFYKSFNNLYADLKECGVDSFRLSCYVSSIWLGIHWGFMVIAITTGLIWLVLSKCELILTDKNVQGKTLFGKKVTIPIYMVSSHIIRPIFSTIVIASNLGFTKFSLIGNIKEISEVLTSMTNERQGKTQSLSQENIPQANSLDELVKLKDLLDKNIITQEEFEKKKNQILGV